MSPTQKEGIVMENLLYKNHYDVNDFIQIHIPTVGEILDCEDTYYTIVSMLTAMPIDMMVQLDNIGIDFTAIDEYELFLLLFDSLKQLDTTPVFGEQNLADFQTVINKENGNIMLVHEDTGAKIDRAIHEQIANTLRKIHHLKKDIRKPANSATKDFLIERARKKLNRNKHHKKISQLENLIIAMVNTEQFPYDFQSVRNLSIYQFNESVQQVVKKVHYEHLMHGIYAGTVNAKDLSQDDLNWLIH